MEQLIQIDKALFKILNGEWTNPFFDWIMLWLRNPEVWMPLYIFLLIFLIINFKKQALWIIIFAVITAAITDSVSSHIFKPYFNRLRPCRDPDMLGMVRLLLHYSPGNGSFTSSHAANHFGLAMFLYTVLKKYFGKWMLLFFVWAFFISYAQVYIGIHYPGDILGGGIFGCLVGYCTAYLFNILVKEKLHPAL